MRTGVSGDMILGALLDLGPAHGLDFPAWSARMSGLGLPGVSLHADTVHKAGIRATRFRVEAPREHAHRGLADIRAILAAADLPAGVKVRADAVFVRLAEAEGRVHGIPPERVHFHEVGAIDSIVDVVGACLALDMLAPEACFTTPFTFGHGTVRTAHGLLAVPVPATVALSRGFPTVRTRHAGELCTPTGTALVTAFAAPLPEGWVGVQRAEGYGAGTRDIEGAANVLRICLLEKAGEGAAAADPAGAADIRGASGAWQVECNLDNMPPELLGYALERLFEAGCLDAWQEPIHMKKNRSAVKLAALCDDAGLPGALAVFAAETATGGVRWFPVRRLVARKGSRSAATRYGEVTLKEVAFPGGPVRLTPEFESCRALARASGAPLQLVYREAQARAAALESGLPGGTAAP